MPQYNREFIEYNTLNLSQQEEESTIDQQIKKYTSKVNNEPVELVGECSMELLLKMFLELRKYATELVFRVNDRDEGLVVFSMLDEEKYQRAGDIKRLSSISEEKYNEIKQNRDKAEQKRLDIRKLWEQSDQNLEQLTHSLWQVDEQSLEELTIENTDELYKPALITLNHFYPHCEAIFYSNKQLK